MAYIIENAYILKNNDVTKCSFLIRENRIAARQPSFSHARLIKMDAEDFIMTPTYCFFNTNIPIGTTNQTMKEYMKQQFIMKGCTTFLTYVQISFEHEIADKLRSIKTALINSPIDFTAGIKIPLQLLSPSLIRKCKKERIPAIFIEINEPNKLEEIPWGWIREALFPYNPPLIPIISNPLKKETKSLLSKWKVIMSKEKIPALFDELEENQPLSIDVLNKIGLYPHKSSLMHGAELSYNLYLRDGEIKKVDEADLFHYHGDRLIVTVHKGKVIRSGTEVLFKPGYGEYIKVRTPAFFSL